MNVALPIATVYIYENYCYLHYGLLYTEGLWHPLDCLRIFRKHIDGTQCILTSFQSPGPTSVRSCSKRDLHMKKYFCSHRHIRKALTTYSGVAAVENH